MSSLDTTDIVMTRNRSTGYFYDMPKIGNSQLTRYYYDINSEPLLNGEIFKDQVGGVAHLGVLFGHAFQGAYEVLNPLDKTALMAVIVLFVMNYINKNRYKVQLGGGGNMMIDSYLSGAENILSPMSKNALIVVASLFLIKYLVNRLKKNKKGGSKKEDRDKEFFKKLTKIIKKNNIKFEKQKGGMVVDTLYTIVSPITANASTLSVSALLILLNKLFKSYGKTTIKKSGGGGYEIYTLLKEIITPLGIDSFLVAIGLTTLTKKFKGGNCGCYDENIKPASKRSKKIKKYGGVEVVGDKALNYSSQLQQQFGCVIPTWGENLIPKCI